MRFLIDMNLSPAWIHAFETEGWEARHWASIGRVNASDSEIMDWACANDFIVFTHDLDFGALLAFSRAVRPSVILLRTRDNLPSALASTVIDVVNRFAQQLGEGALVIIDTHRNRVRTLPLR